MFQWVRNDLSAVQALGISFGLNTGNWRWNVLHGYGDTECDDGAKIFPRRLLRTLSAVASASRKVTAQHKPRVVKKESACFLDLGFYVGGS